MRIMSEIWVAVFLRVPAGNSITCWACQKTGEIRNGARASSLPTTLPWLSRNKASIAKRMKKVWILLQRVRTKESPVSREDRFSKPTNLLLRVRQINPFSAKTVPRVIFLIFIGNKLRYSH
jgi:hypothetical protein